MHGPVTTNLNLCPYSIRNGSIYIIFPLETGFKVTFDWMVNIFNW